MSEIVVAMIGALAPMLMALVGTAAYLDRRNDRRAKQVIDKNSQEHGNSMKLLTEVALAVGVNKEKIEEVGVRLDEHIRNHPDGR